MDKCLVEIKALYKQIDSLSESSRLNSIEIEELEEKIKISRGFRDDNYEELKRLKYLKEKSKGLRKKLINKIIWLVTSIIIGFATVMLFAKDILPLYLILPTQLMVSSVVFFIPNELVSDISLSNFYKLIKFNRNNDVDFLIDEASKSFESFDKQCELYDNELYTLISIGETLNENIEGLAASLNFLEDLRNDVINDIILNDESIQLRIDSCLECVCDKELFRDRVRVRK